MIDGLKGYSSVISFISSGAEYPLQMYLPNRYPLRNRKGTHSNEAVPSEALATCTASSRIVRSTTLLQSTWSYSLVTTGTLCKRWTTKWIEKATLIASILLLRSLKRQVMPLSLRASGTQICCVPNGSRRLKLYDKEGPDTKVVVQKTQIVPFNPLDHHSLLPWAPRGKERALFVAQDSRRGATHACPRPRASSPSTPRHARPKAVEQY